MVAGKSRVVYGVIMEEEGGTRLLHVAEKQKEQRSDKKNRLCVLVTAVRSGTLGVGMLFGWRSNRAEVTAGERVCE